MFTNVLIAEDHESTNISLRKTLDDLEIKNSNYVYYCDDALLQIKNNFKNQTPIDLLITDLSFDSDHREQQITEGEILIVQARQIQPSLKVLVFSAESRPATKEYYYQTINIDGFVQKGRNDAQELKQAIMRVAEGRKYYPINLRQDIQQKNAHQFSSFDIIVLTLLAQGISQKQIPELLENKSITPSSLSSIEKRLKLIRDSYSFSSNEQLIAFCTKKGIIKIETSH